jgi:hypothetical protein
MSTRARVSHEIHEAAVHFNRVLRQRPEPPDAILSNFIEICQNLPPESSAVDLVLVLQPRVCRQLESIALRKFQARLRPRSSMANVKTVPRAITELRSASKAWHVSLLVLLVEFADAPLSDNFWRAVSRLARCDGGTGWAPARERLHAERDRRRNDLLARRKGVSYTQPWAIPDVEAVLQNEKDRCEGQDNVESGMAVEGAERDGSSGQRPQDKAPIGVSRALNSDALEAEGTKGASQPSLWPLASGWWIFDDIMLRVCDSLVQIEPMTYAAVDPLRSRPGPPTTIQALDQAATTHIIAPVLINKSAHWVLFLLSRPERLVSLFDPIPSRQSRADATDAFERILSRTLPKERLADWTIVPRSCPTMTNGVDSGMAVVVFALYYLVGRPLPLTIDVCLWRRMLAYYLAHSASAGHVDDADVELANDAAAKHTSTTRAKAGRRPQGGDDDDDAVEINLAEGLAVLLDDVAEARAVWVSAAGVTAQAAGAAPAASHARRSSRVVEGAISAVLEDIDRLVDLINSM